MKSSQICYKKTNNKTLGTSVINLPMSICLSVCNDGSCYSWTDMILFYNVQLLIGPGKVYNFFFFWGGGGKGGK